MINTDTEKKLNTTATMTKQRKSEEANLTLAKV